MKANKLFNVLVLGGWMLAGSGATAEEPVSPIPIPQQEELAPLFCDPKEPTTCVPNQCGKLEAPKGFECCWGTSCEEK